MPSKKLFRIGRSHTGLGLFAVEPIKSRQFIVRYSGRLVAAEVADRLERYRRNKFLFEVNRHWCIDGTTRRNLARYVNHSCRPNADAVIRRGTRRVDYVANRRIESGEEITVDYGKDYMEMFFEKDRCKCEPCRKRRARKRRKQRELRARKNGKNGQH
ncbi:MAG TPA: SET domain-containing protein [Pseudolabrys sp.]|nr:SET domain-containing protein [Pseudolabrys sp.]